MQLLDKMKLTGSFFITGWGPKLPRCDTWGYLCLKWEVVSVIRSSSICYWWCSLWSCEMGFTGHTTSWAGTRRNNLPDIWDDLSLLFYK